MPDLRTILRSFAPAHALRNAQRDVVEHERVLAEIDAVVRRLPAAREADRDIAPGPGDTLTEEPRAS